MHQHFQLTFTKLILNNVIVFNVASHNGYLASFLRGKTNFESKDDSFNHWSPSLIYAQQHY